MSQVFITEQELDVLRKASEIIAKIDARPKGGVYSLDSTALKVKSKKELIKEKAQDILKR